MTSPTRSPESTARTRDLARVLDEAIRIPGTNIRIGLDALLGLLPGGGDIAGGALSALIMLQAARAGAPTSVLARMLGNVVVDTVVGTIPLLGDLFDVAWRANSKNVRLLESWREHPAGTRRASKLAVAGFLAALGVLVFLAVWGAIALGGALFDLLRGT
ncbi:MAG: DUF4112 domain-containing protein [Gemmatimonadaceae bacterium]